MMKNADIDDDNLFPVFVKFNQQTFPLQISSNYSVRKVKNCITDMLGCAEDSQALFLVLGQDLELNDERTVGEYSIFKWHTIHLILKFFDDAGSLVIFVETFNGTIKSSRGQCVSLETNTNDDIEMVKQLLERQEGIAVDSQSLYYGKKKLPDGKTLGEICVSYFSTLRCVVQDAPVSPSRQQQQQEEDSNQQRDAEEEKSRIKARSGRMSAKAVRMAPIRLANVEDVAAEKSCGDSKSGVKHISLPEMSPLSVDETTFASQLPSSSSSSSVASPKSILTAEEKEAVSSLQYPSFDAFAVDEDDEEIEEVILDDDSSFEEWEEVEASEDAVTTDGKQQRGNRVQEELVLVTPDKFLLNIRTPAGVAQVPVKRGTTVRALKRALEDILGVAVGQQVLFKEIGGEPLDSPDASMWDIDANEHDPLFLFLHTGDNSIVTIFVEIVSGALKPRVVPIDVTAHESALDLKRALGRLLQVNTGTLQLYHDMRTEKEIPDACSLMELQLESFQRFTCICQASKRV